MKIIVVYLAIMAVIVPPMWANHGRDPRQSVLLLEILDADGVKLGSGSCYVIAHKGDWWYAATAKHCVEDASGWLADGHKAELVRKDPDADVAMIRFKAPDESYTVLQLADPEIGEVCTAVGWAGDTFVQYKGFVVGINFKVGDDKHVVANSGLFPGCSGGPLLNSSGEVIGTTSAVAARGAIFDSTGLFVPVKYIRAMLPLIE